MVSLAVLLSPRCDPLSPSCASADWFAHPLGRDTPVAEEEGVTAKNTATSMPWSSSPEFNTADAYTFLTNDVFTKQVCGCAGRLSP